jgi:fatty acid desaturase
MSNPTAPVSVKSSSKAVELGPDKAIASGITATVIAFLTATITANADGAITSGEWLTVALATAVGVAAGFGITYATPTSVTLR